MAYTPRHADVYAVKPTVTWSSPPVDSVVTQLVTVRVALTDKMSPTLHTGTSCSIQQLGGIKCFLFLLAKVRNAFLLVLPPVK